MFSKLDLGQGYHQIVLDENSRDITTFRTPQGLFRYKLLNLAAKNAFGDFQKVIRTNITHDIDGVFKISDDIIAHAITQNENLHSFEKFLTRCERNARNLTLKSVNLVNLILITWDIF